MGNGVMALNYKKKTLSTLAIFGRLVCVECEGALNIPTPTVIKLFLSASKAKVILKGFQLVQDLLLFYFFIVFVSAVCLQWFILYCIHQNSFELRNVFSFFFVFPSFRLHDRDGRPTRRATDSYESWHL